MRKSHSIGHRKTKRTINRTNNFMNMTMAQMVKDEEVNPLVGNGAQGNSNSHGSNKNTFKTPQVKSKRPKVKQNLSVSPFLPTFD